MFTSAVGWCACLSDWWPRNYITACEQVDFLSTVTQLYLRTSEYQVPACVARRTLDMLFPILANFCSQWLHDCEIVERTANFLIPWSAGSSSQAELHMRMWNSHGKPKRVSVHECLQTLFVRGRRRFKRETTFGQLSFLSSYQMHPTNEQSLFSFLFIIETKPVTFVNFISNSSCMPRNTVPTAASSCFCYALYYFSPFVD